MLGTADYLVNPENNSIRYMLVIIHILQMNLRLKGISLLVKSQADYVAQRHQSQVGLTLRHLMLSFPPSQSPERVTTPPTPRGQHPQAQDHTILTASLARRSSADIKATIKGGIFNTF